MMEPLVENLNAVSLVTLFLLVSVMVNLYFINASIEKKRKNKKEEKLFPSLLRKHLKEQSEKTANSKKNLSIPELYTTVVKLRSAYLMIESKAVGRGIDSDEYWNLINAKIKALVDIIIKFESNPTLRSIERKVKSIKNIIFKLEDVKDKKLLFSCLDRFYRSCVENSNISNLKRYDEKLNQILARFGDKQLSTIDSVAAAHAEHASQSEAAINNRGMVKGVSEEHPITEVSDRVGSLINSYNEDKDTIDRSMSNIKSSLSDTEYKISNAVIKNIDPESGSLDSSDSVREILEISEQLQRKNEEEIVYLKKMVSNQKETIFALEIELSKTHNKKTSSEDSSDVIQAEPSPFESEIDRLKTNLRDAEFCITVLEDEQRILQEKIRTVKVDLSSSETTGGLDYSDVSELKETIRKLEVAAFNDSVEANFLRVFHEFSQEAVKLVSLEDLAMHTFVCLGEIGIDGQFVVKSEDREFVVSETGVIDEKERVIIKNLSMNESSQAAKNTKLFTRYQCISGVLTLNDRSVITKNTAKQALAFVQFADNVMKSIIHGSKSKSTKRSLDQQCNSIKMKTHDIDKQLLDVFSSVEKSVTANVKNIQELARASGINASAISKMRAYELEIMNEISSNKTVSLKIKKAFIEILNDLEKIY